MKDRSRIIFENEISNSTVNQADKQKNKFIKKFGDDSNV